jgi:hypothetical protein
MTEYGPECEFGNWREFADWLGLAWPERRASAGRAERSVDALVTLVLPKNSRHAPNYDG